MNPLDFREPVAAWSHLVGFLLAWPATAWLLYRSNGSLGKRVASLLFGFGLVVCYLGSTLYHGVRTEELIPTFHTLDYVGIYFLIAGSVSPVALILLRGGWRWVSLTAVWALALVGIFLQVFFAQLPSLVAIGLFFLMGWGIIFAYFELSRVVSQRALNLALLGGVFYSVGAGIHVMRWPVLVPGYFGSHDLFHILVLCGSTCHYLFMLKVVAPFQPKVVPLPVALRTQPLAAQEAAWR
jgi:hemolysin III